MSLKQQTIEVRRCDFCISTSEARACQHCEKDACPNCAKVYKLTPENWNPSPNTVTFGAHSAFVYTAFLCNECRENELPTILLRFGFYDPAMRQADTA